MTIDPTGHSPEDDLPADMQFSLGRYIVYLQAERNSSPCTVLNYRRDIQEFGHFCVREGGSHWGCVEKVMLRSWLAWLADRHIVRASIARKITEVRSFYRFMMREQLVAANPLLGLSSPKVPQRLPTFMGYGDVIRLLNCPDTSSPQGMRDRAILELLYASGIRLAEIGGLNVSCINLDSREIRVWGKGSKERVVLIGQPAAEALRSYFQVARLQLMEGARGGAGADLSAVFLNRFGRRLSVRSIDDMLQRYSRAIGLRDRITPHVLRHTFATHMLEGGADLRVVQELLGHARLATTQVYTHVTETQARKVYQAAHPRGAVRAAAAAAAAEGGGQA